MKITENTPQNVICNQNFAITKSINNLKSAI